MLSSLCFALSVLYSVTTSIQPDSPTCTTAVECRQAANEALGREDYERFHSLAWRVVQTSKANDRDAMLLLARASSLHVWAAVIAQSTIVRVSPTREVTTIATDADGLDWASSIAFGKNDDLWAVNFAIGPTGGPGPALLRLDVRTKGQPVP